MNQTAGIIVRWVMITVSVVVLGMIGAAGANAGWDFWQKTKAQREQDNRLEEYRRLVEKVQISISYDPLRCAYSKRYSIVVVDITNNSDKSITHTGFRINAHRLHYSNSLYIASLGPNFNTDRIIEPNETWSVCMHSEMRLKGEPIESVKWSVEAPLLRFD